MDQIVALESTKQMKTTRKMNDINHGPEAWLQPHIPSSACGSKYWMAC